MSFLHIVVCIASLMERKVKKRALKSKSDGFLNLRAFRVKKHRRKVRDSRLLRGKGKKKKERKEQRNVSLLNISRMPILRKHSRKNRVLVPSLSLNGLRYIEEDDEEEDEDHYSACSICGNTSNTKFFRLFSTQEDIDSTSNKTPPSIKEFCQVNAPTQIMSDRMCPDCYKKYCQQIVFLQKKQRMWT
ncbi:MAG: hypothetical protein ACTSUE_04195 [Promethearchaeota archaeon]